MGMKSDQYARQLDALLPRGRAWSRDPDLLMRSLTLGLADEFARVDARADKLISEILPNTTLEMLQDWERVAGLPDTCAAGRSMRLGAGTFGIDNAGIKVFSRASSATYFNAAGLLVTAANDVPRFDYDPITHALRGLLIEGAATNYLKYSEQFDNVIWGKGNCTITPNAAIAPDGNMTAEAVVRTAPGNHYLLQNIGTVVAAGKPFTASIYMKSGSYTGLVRVWLKDGAGVSLAINNAQLTPAWQRFSISGTYPIGATGNPAFYIDPSDDVGLAGDTFYVWAADVKDGLQISSYIPTAAAPASRAADLCDIYLPETMQERRNALLSRLTSTGGQSRAFFIELAAYLGFAITITEYKQFRAGASRIGDVVNDVDWLHAWRINASSVTVVAFRAGASAVGEPLRKWGNELLECVFKRVAPAHTKLLFGYS